MTTPIVMHLLMTGPYLLVHSLSAGAHHDLDARSAAAVGLGLLFMFTGAGHFVQTDLMSEMLPPWIPGRVPLVHATGVLELAIAVGFFLPRTRRFTGWVAAAMLVSFFPVNVYAAINHASMGGHAWGPVYLLVRGPLQVALWMYWFRPPIAAAYRSRRSTVSAAVSWPARSQFFKDLSVPFYGANRPGAQASQRPA